jgi:hypothetical protein
MKKNYKGIIILLVAMLMVVGAVLILNREKKREIVLTDFKHGQEYQFGEVIWNSSVEEVEDLLDCTLEDVTVHSPEKDYVFYDFSDVVYVLNGHEAKASVEFRADELVYIGFTFKELENLEDFAEEIIAISQDKYGPESKFNENDTTGFSSYRWRTEASQLAVGFDGIEVTIFLASIK